MSLIYAATRNSDNIESFSLIEEIQLQSLFAKYHQSEPSSIFDLTEEEKGSSCLWSKYIQTNQVKYVFLSFSIKKVSDGSRNLEVDVFFLFIYPDGGIWKEKHDAEGCLVTEEMLDHNYYLTGLYYLRARYYNTGIGRFTQKDVIYNDGLNLYAYCSSNPVMYADSSGYSCEPKDGAENSKWGTSTGKYRGVQSGLPMQDNFLQGTCLN